MWNWTESQSVPSKWRFFLNTQKKYIAILIIAIGICLGIGFYLTNSPKLKHSTAVMSLFDQIGLYQKNGSVEIYGASLRQRNASPISISHSLIQIQEKNSLLLWIPDYTTAADADYIEIQLRQPLIQGSFQIGLSTQDGTAFLFNSISNWKHKFLARLFFKREKPATFEIPDLIQQAFLHPTQTITLRHDTALRYYAPLPGKLVQLLKQQPLNSHKIKAWFIAIHNAANTTIDFERIALVKRTSLPSSQQSLSLEGSIEGIKPQANSLVTLITEKGEHYQQPLSADGHFTFSGLKSNVPVSLRYHHNARDYYSVHGRWLLPETLKTLIDVSPSYANPEKHFIDTSKNHFNTAKHPEQAALYSAFYEPHTPQIWNGAGEKQIQEYNSRTFANNYGYIDRDRFIDNPDGCFRIVYLGSSHAVALQVKLFERYNMELESELGVKIGRCVEVISAGRDNGDIGSNYPRVRDYALRFHPDAILIENSSSLLMQLHPKFLKEVVGWDAAHNALDDFYYDQNHLIQFRPMDTNYPLYTTKPTFPQYLPGLNFVDTLKIDFAFLPKEAIESFQYFADIAKYFITHHPKEHFIFMSGLDEAQCKGKCNYTIKTPNGDILPVGAKIFTKNFQAVCAQNNLTCISAQAPEGQHDTEDTYLTFIYDGHYRQQGHQWLARQLSDGLMPIFKTAFNKK